MDLRAKIEPLDCEDPPRLPHERCNRCCDLLVAQAIKGLRVRTAGDVAGDDPTLTNRLPWQTASTAASSSLPA
jgi:hypothetical protein